MWSRCLPRSSVAGESEGIRASCWYIAARTMKYPRGQRWRFAVALLAVAMGVWLTLTPPPGAPTKPSAAAKATERSLDRKLPELEWVETSLDSALNAIERG